MTIQVYRACVSQCKQKALLRWSPHSKRHLQRVSSGGYKEDQRFLFVDGWQGEVVARVTQEYKVALAVGNVDCESSQSNYGNILHWYWEQSRYPSPKEAMAKGQRLSTKKVRF